MVSLEEAEPASRIPGRGGMAGSRRSGSGGGATGFGCGCGARADLALGFFAERAEARFGGVFLAATASREGVLFCRAGCALGRVARLTGLFAGFLAN